MQRVFNSASAWFCRCAPDAKRPPSCCARRETVYEIGVIERLRAPQAIVV